MWGGFFLKRTGRVIFVFLLLIFCMLGLWIFQAWKESRQNPEREILPNVYIVSVSGTAVTFVDGEQVRMESASPVSGGGMEGIIADIHTEKNKIVKIIQKPESVAGTIQKIDGGSIVLDEYGEVAFADEFCVYHKGKDGIVTKGEADELRVGQPEVRFFVAGDRICAAVVPDKPIENIRVLLGNSDFTSYEQDKAVLTASCDMNVRQKGEIKVYKKGESVTFLPEDITGEVIADTGNRGKIKIETLKRQCGVPEYRGRIRITKSGENAIHLVNELSLEEYLYSVVPSEMPTGYEEEALKAQAVCARTYAAAQMSGKRLARYGAHVDDSVSFQVYNNQKEDARSIEAVNATKGEIAVYRGKPAGTYFYSSSCGSRAGTKDVWYTKKDVPYLPSGTEKGNRELSAEKDFRAFIQSEEESLDAGSAWYRWSAVIPEEKIRESIEKNLAARIAANSTQIQVKQEDGSYRSKNISTLGEIKNITVKKRGKGGVVTVADMEGSQTSIRVYTEYNIRALLGGTDIVYNRNNGGNVNGLRLLPSGFFYVDRKDNSFTFTGGGYGHGVGMSQNGADALAERGKTYKEILTFYFPGINVQRREAVG